MFQPRPENLIDFYKSGHHKQYPKGTTLVFSNFTPRSFDKFKPFEYTSDHRYVFFGLQAFIQHYLIDLFNEQFFELPLKTITDRATKRLSTAIGDTDMVPRLAALHQLGYLPIAIRALPEGMKVPTRTACLVIYNTHPDFFWLPNYLETLLSSELWHPITSATTADVYKQIITKAAKQTGGSLDFVPWQGHDFSARGMSGIWSSMASGAGHLLSFTGTDTVSAIDWLEHFYPGEGFVGGSVAATEHSVMCTAEEEGEFELLKRLITEVYPKGIISIVGDTWNLWKLISDYLPRLKKEILAREGKVVIRPDSGDPVEIICGNMSGKLATTDLHEQRAERAGAVEALYNIFGGTVKNGYATLDPHIGVIYGDSITTDRCVAILGRLAAKGFSSDNVVFGIGSYTYQYVTRDSLGQAMKATYVEVNGNKLNIFKKPITDTGMKNSARGLLRVVNKDGKLVQEDGLTSFAEVEAPRNEMKEVFRDGKATLTYSLSDIRNRLREQ